MIPALRTIGMIEGLSAFVLFCIAMPMKHVFQTIGEREFFWIGMAHGVLWMIYALVATIALVAKQIRIRQYLILGIFSLFPLGPLIGERLAFPRKMQN